MDQLPPELNIITLNCWGLKHISTHRSARLTQIGRELAQVSPPPHIVALQECWTQEDYQSIRRETRFVLPYGKFYHSGPFGSGLAILSKWPIEESSMYQYPLNGRPTAFWRGDWFVGKGVAHAKIRYGSGVKEVVEVFNTHTHAQYEQAKGESGGEDTYICHGLAQAWEISKLMRGAAERGHLVVGLGDFNMTPLSLPHRIICAHAPVRDAWRVLHPDSSLGPADGELESARRRPIPTAEFNIRENGATSDNVLNTWRWPKSQQKQLGSGKDPQYVPMDSIDGRGKRLDYIFASTGITTDSVAAHFPGSPATGWVVKDVRVGMLDRHPELQCSLSDHFSVEATLVFHTGSSNPTRRRQQQQQQPHQQQPEHEREETIAAGSDEDLQVTNGTYLQSPASSPRNSRNYDEQLRLGSRGGHGSTETEYLSGATYDEILGILHKYMQRERAQRRWRGIHFSFWVMLVLACYIAVWFCPPPAAFVLLLLSSFGFLAGSVDGLIALLFMKSEMGALKEFEWEIMNAKASALGVGGLVGSSEEPKTW